MLNYNLHTCVPATTNPKKIFLPHFFGQLSLIPSLMRALEGIKRRQILPKEVFNYRIMAMERHSNTDMVLP